MGDWFEQLIITVRYGIMLGEKVFCKPFIIAGLRADNALDTVTPERLSRMNISGRSRCEQKQSRLKSRGQKNWWVQRPVASLHCIHIITHRCQTLILHKSLPRDAPRPNQELSIPKRLKPNKKYMKHGETKHINDPR